MIIHTSVFIYFSLWTFITLFYHLTLKHIMIPEWCKIFIFGWHTIRHVCTSKYPLLTASLILWTIIMILHDIWRRVVGNFLDQHFAISFYFTLLLPAFTFNRNVFICAIYANCFTGLIFAGRCKPGWGREANLHHAQLMIIRQNTDKPIISGINYLADWAAYVTCIIVWVAAVMDKVHCSHHTVIREGAFVIILYLFHAMLL